MHSYYYAYGLYILDFYYFQCYTKIDRKTTVYFMAKFCFIVWYKIILTGHPLTKICVVLHLMAKRKRNRYLNVCSIVEGNSIIQKFAYYRSVFEPASVNVPYGIYLVVICQYSYVKLVVIADLVKLCLRLVVQ